MLAQRIGNSELADNIFLNVNMPDLPLNDAKGIRLTRLARKSHVNSVEEGHDEKRAYYMLTRASVNNQVDPKSDIKADEHRKRQFSGGTP